MKIFVLKYTVLTWVTIMAMIIIALVPFHAFLTVWGSSTFGHYTALRLWKEVLLLLSVVAVLYILAIDHKTRNHTLTRRLVWLILAYMGLTFLLGAIAYSRHTVGVKALGYGLVSDLRYLAFFLVTWAAALRLDRLRANWSRLVLIPAMIVVIFGILQIFILPHDVLRHFGYGPRTIPAFETINSNKQYYRIMSTLRGANPLGAYMVIPITALTVLIVRSGLNWRRILALAGSVLVLFFSFSRSAWIGTAISVALVLSIALKAQRMRRLFLVATALIFILGAGLVLGLRNNTRVENFVFHTQTHSAVKTTSDQGHLTATKNGLIDLIHQPFGRGPGTAGPASVYTPHPRIAENYYVQIGQETGWLGMALFVLINIGVGYLLWLRRSDPLALTLFASLIGLTFINMLSHAWADDTLAYIWWGLAGIAMVQLPGKNEK